MELFVASHVALALTRPQSNTEPNYATYTFRGLLFATRHLATTTSFKASRHPVIQGISTRLRKFMPRTGATPSLCILMLNQDTARLVYISPL